MKIVITMLLSMSLASCLFAGQEAGNGGVGVRQGEKIYLLDFAENGIEESAYVENMESYDPDIYEVIQRKFDIDGFPGKENTSKIVAAKLTELRRHSPQNAYLLTRIIAELDWRIVNFDLIRTNDEKSTLLLGDNRVQLAVRVRSTVRLNKDFLSALNDLNRAGLILHEARYAAEPFSENPVVITETIRAHCAASLLDFKDCVQKAGFDILIQEVQRTRDYIGALFTKGFESFLDTRIEDPMRNSIDRKKKVPFWEYMIYRGDFTKSYNMMRPRIYSKDLDLSYFYDPETESYYSYEPNFQLKPVSKEKLISQFCKTGDSGRLMPGDKEIASFSLEVEKKNNQFAYSATVSTWSRRSTLFVKECEKDIVNFLRGEE